LKEIAMEITPTTPAKSAATQAKTAEADGLGAMTGDFETFLKLLTTQMRNQDPLKPIESTEFVAQLASFSAVEQQIRANDRLERILEALSGGTAAGLAEWIGREVRAPARAAFTGAPVEVGVAPKQDADRAVLLVKNDFGQEVARLQVEAGAGSVTWDGRDSMGNAVAHGLYGFTLESYQGETLLGSEPGMVFTTVSEIRIVDGSPVLVTADGSQIPLDQVGAVR
jgi:flagellar basal-body rod modification protein FlgD